MKKDSSVFELLTLIGEFVSMEVGRVADITYDRSKERFSLVMENNEILIVTVKRQSIPNYLKHKINNGISGC